MNDWMKAAAARLDLVREACDEFILRDLIDGQIIGPMLLDRLAADLAAGQHNPNRGHTSLHSQRRFADKP